MRVGLLISLLLAEPEPIAWTGEQTCPGSEQALAEALEGYLGQTAREPESMAIAIRIEPGQGSGPRLQLTIASDVGRERHGLRGPNCAAVIDQAALLIASAIDPFLFVWRPPGQPPRAEPIATDPPVQRPRPREVEAVPVRPPEPPELAVDVRPPPSEGFGPLVVADPDPEPERARQRPTGTIGAAATGFVGLFPQVGGGAEIEGALERRALRWQLTGAGWFGGRFRSTQADLGGDLWALTLGTGLCGVPSTRRVRVPLCGVGGVGLIHATAVGTLDARRSIQPWAWSGAEVRVVLLARPRLGIGLGVGIHASVLRPAWAVSLPDAVFRVPPVSGIVRLTVEFRQLGRNSRNSSITSIARGQ